MQRRQFVTTASATIAAAGIAGCSDILGGDGGSSGPESAIEAYVDAFNDNDPEAFEAAIHPDAPAASSMPSESEMEPISMSIESSEVTEGPENGEAVIEAEIETTVEVMGQEQSETQTASFEVRTHEGDWKLYQEA